MAMQLINNKGFILLDSLVCVIVTCLLCFLCFSVFTSLDKHYEGYQRYAKDNNEEYEYLFNGLNVCQKCVIEEDVNKDLP